MPSVKPIDWWAVAFIAMICGPAPLFKMADVAWANWMRGASTNGSRHAP